MPTVDKGDIKTGDVFADELLRLYRTELHKAYEMNRQLAKVLWAVRDELTLWRQVGTVAAVRKRSRTTRRIILPNGTRAIQRS